MPDATSIAQRRRRSAGSVWLMLTLLVLGSVGCRGLRRGQRDQGLNEARYFSLRGADALQVAKVEDAEALFAEALRRCPNDERAHWGMSEIHSQRGDCQAAAFHMQEAARMSGNNPDLLVKLEIYRGLARYPGSGRKSRTGAGRQSPACGCFGNGSAAWPSTSSRGRGHAAVSSR